jgi:hypothetical protein
LILGFLGVNTDGIFLTGLQFYLLEGGTCLCKFEVGGVTLMLGLLMFLVWLFGLF